MAVILTPSLQLPWRHFGTVPAIQETEEESCAIALDLSRLLGHSGGNLGSRPLPSRMSPQYASPRCLYRRFYRFSYRTGSLGRCTVEWPPTSLFTSDHPKMVSLVRHEAGARLRFLQYIKAMPSLSWRLFISLEHHSCESYLAPAVGQQQSNGKFINPT